MTAYYNENDPGAAAWLRELIAGGHIAPGIVDERDIRDIRPDELRGFTQCHLFAGIGGWSLALRLAGWTDDRPAWTGSCPCQPFSAAGKRGGTSDERHLWPAFFHLIDKCRPAGLFGEQVASKDGLAWLDTVRSDLEGAGYAVGAADLCAAGIGAPHIRQRLWFGAVGLADAALRGQPGGLRERGSAKRPAGALGGYGAAGGMGDALGAGLEGHAGHGDGAPGRPVADRPVAPTSQSGGLADANSAGSQPGQPSAAPARHRDTPVANGGNGRSGSLHEPWRDADWLYCRDGKWRPVEPGTFPLAHGIPGRVGLLRGYGNAIVPQVAATFIEAFCEAADRPLLLEDPFA